MHFGFSTNTDSAKRPGDDILRVLIQSVFVSNATKIYNKTSENQGITDSLNVFQYDSYIHWELAFLNVELSLDSEGAPSSLAGALERE